MTARRLVLAFLTFAAAAALPASGCTVQFSATTADGNGNQTVHSPYSPDAADGSPETDGVMPGDDGGPAAPAFQGSPLCNASKSTGCYPDDPTNAKSCKLAPDGGPYDANAGYDNATLACHVVPNTNDTSSGAPMVKSVCLPAGMGRQGMACSHPTDCAPSFECVGTNSGTCQHYCCAGNTECAADEFCDIQPTAAATNTRVPVCMPIMPALGCKLLDPTSCPAMETCAVVREDGTTSCIALGGLKAGDDCARDHCAAGLVCLGAPGDRRCYQLCHTATMTDCAAGLKCKGGLPLFPDPDVGVCEQ
jgi:hypothetical protein